MNKRFLGLLAILSGLLWGAVLSFPNNRLHLIFCDVGQGDAILVSQGFKQILIDGGPNDKVLGCLSRNMPFFDKEIEVVISTHPDYDHTTGLVSVLDKYKVKLFIGGPVGTSASSFEALLTKVKEKKIKVVNLYSKERLKLGDISLKSLWPEKQWLVGKVGFLGERNVLGLKTEERNLNDFSLVFLLQYKNSEVLLMGDADSRVQDEIMRINNLEPVDILKFPHHGSKTGVSEEFLAKIKPQQAVISVGKNSYGHPTKEALDLLKKYKVKLRRTDLEGEIKYLF